MLRACQMANSKISLTAYMQMGAPGSFGVSPPIYIDLHVILRTQQEVFGQL